ncbi:MAG: DUF2384 domain-containing protein [Actinobacteria bacterium]|nr:DUF2384 domain-containing protein [Actinomycetota bacterium]
MKHNERVEKVTEATRMVFLDESIADDWLHSYNSLLNAKPVELLCSDEGMSKVLLVLSRIQHGVYS